MLWLCLWRLRWRLLGLPLIAAGLASPLLADPPDLLVSGDARLIALRTADAVLLERRSGGSGLTRDAWLRLWGVAAAVPMPADGVACNRDACLLRARPEGPAVLLVRGDVPPEACAAAALVVSAEPLRGRCRGWPAIDRFDVWRNGPHAAWLRPGGVEIVSDREARGDRPWVPPLPRPRAAEEPPAESE
jgi:competence protein ComEC